MKFHLAPLEGVSDCAFRTLCYNYGADVTYTEMIRVDGIIRRNKATMALLDLKNDVPTIIQLLVVKPSSARKFVAMFSTLFTASGIKPVGVNLNLGCPSPDVICEGGGAALVKRTSRVQELVTILKQIGVPVTLKIRLGLNQLEKDKMVYLNLVNGVDADGFIVHARHARQESHEPADWLVFEELVKTGKKIIANGDICTAADVAFFNQIGIQEVMIGRAAVRNPVVFSVLKGGCGETLDVEKGKYLQLCSKYPSHPKYQKNVLAYLGKGAQMRGG